MARFEMPFTRQEIKKAMEETRMPKIVIRSKDTRKAIKISAETHGRLLNLRCAQWPTINTVVAELIDRMAPSKSMRGS